MKAVSCVREAFKEIRQRPFSADRRAEEHGKKINGFIAANASAHQTNLMGKGRKRVPSLPDAGP